MTRLHGLSWLALLWVLTGCAAQPSPRGARGYEQQAVNVDFEEPTPRQAEELRHGGVQLPRFFQGTADPRTHRDFIDLRVTAVGFGITAGGYLLYCEGLPQPVLVPESYVDLGLSSATPLNASIYPDRDAALDDLEAVGAGRASFAYYRGAGGALIVPTLFTPATTPRIARTMFEVRQHLSETVQRELKVLLLTLTGTKVLQGVFSRVVRASLRPESLPRPRPAPSAPESALEPATPAPVPSGPAPSPGLVQALAGNNPTPRVDPRSRLPQDVAVDPMAPKSLETNRPVGSSPSQNAQVQSDIRYLRNVGATNIRVNQQQLMLDDLPRVGVNRPDLQFDYQGRRYHVEYETPTSSRGPGHQARTTSNDPSAEIILLIVP